MTDAQWDAVIESANFFRTSAAVRCTLNAEVRARFGSSPMRRSRQARHEPRPSSNSLRDARDRRVALRFFFDQGVDTPQLCDIMDE